MLYFFDRAMQGKGFLNQPPGFSVPLIWHHFVFKEHMRNWNPNVKLTCLVLCNLTHSEHIFRRWGNRPPQSPEFTQVLMWTQDYISCPLSPSPSWFPPFGTAPSTSSNSRFIFLASESQTPLTDPAVTSSNSYWDRWNCMSKWSGCKLMETTEDCDKSKRISTV